MQQSRLQTIENQLKKLTKKINCSTQFYDSIQDFPEVGSLCAIYIDRSTGAVYIYDEDTDTYVSSDTGLTPELSGSGSSGQVAYWTGATTLSGESTLYYDAANNRLGVNQPVPAYPLDVVGNTSLNGNVYLPTSGKYLFIGTDTASYAFNHLIRAVGTSDASIAIFRNQVSSSPAKLEFFRSRGTYAAPASLNANDQIFNIAGFGWGSSSTQYGNSAAITAFADSIGTTNVGGRISFTTWNSSGNNFTTATIRNSTSAPGSGGTFIIASSTSEIITSPQGTLHVRGTDTTSSNNSFYLENSGTTQLFKVANDGQVLIGTGSYGSSRLTVRGSGTTSATTALLVQNSTPTEVFTIKDNGWIGVGASNISLYPYSSIGIPNLFGKGMAIAHNFSGAAGTGIAVVNAQESGRTATSGESILIRMVEGFAPTSGTGTFISTAITGTINQTGGANGITRGLYVNPTLTAAADWRSIETSNNTGFAVYTAGTANSYFGGNVGIGTTTPGASFETTSSIRMSGAGSQTFEFSAATRGQFRAIFGGFSFRSSTGVFISNADGDPSARLHVRGSGTTSATTALLVQNSTPTDLFRIYDNGSVVIGTGLAGFATTTNSLNINSNLSGLSAGTDFIFGSSQGTNASTSGISNVIILRSGASQSFNPTSGTGVFNVINIPTTINQTGGANGITRGLYVNPTLTSAADWRGVEIATSTVNTVVLGKNTGSAAVEVTSTTQGFLPPRMTTAQRDLIATPAAGLVIFNTTTTKLECFDGAVWQAAW